MAPITISSAEEVNVNTKNVNINASENMNVNVGKNFTMQVGEQSLVGIFISHRQPIIAQS
jgi:rhs element vgr protein family protein